MSNLYLKYRPKSFNDIVGNKSILTVLRQMTSDRKTCPHTFLLHGPTGCGKTTIARIIAKELGCTADSFHEMDTAHFRGIDTVREMRTAALYKPMTGAVSVWLIDEIQKMTGEAQNALLKILEDSPPHAYFILATTEPHMVIKTVRNRCLEFQVAHLDDGEMRTLLERVVTLEDKKLNDKIYKEVINASEGSPRKALQIMDSVLAVPKKQRAEIINKSIGEQQQSIELCRALIKRDSWKVISRILKELKGQDPESIRRHVLGYAQSVLLNSDNGYAAGIIEEFADNFWNSGFPGLVLACYAVNKS